ncbi:anosmin-1b isoform X1 [Megalops cyprinoides]|uniref:anosmin-1b isoform X1 n=1 Tax=Megalops cyprinoides TaxID=118141 RepID=UPI00186506F5|nr:anosmin-1b isoform X1 [Megalops cyprinoides]
MTLVFMWCLFASTGARRTGAEDGENSEKIYSARCTSRCLTLHMTQLTAAFKHLQSDDVLGWCENHRRCSQCLQPCRELWETRRIMSQKACEKHHECLTSSEFLMTLQTLKQGDCPPPQKASGFAAACVESCSGDRECSGSKKCCSNGCGHTCQAPANLFKGVPLKPKKDMSFLEDQLGQLEVTWMSKFNVSIEPVLYVLQRRWNYGIHPSEDDATPWQTVLMTMEDRVVLKDVRPHRWYQFRVSAVNSQGTRGFTTPSKHFFSSRDPFPPEMPRNVRGGNFSVRADGTVSVLLLWEPPADEDLAVHHYKVTWSVRVARRTGHDRKENSRVTEGVVSEIELEGLQPNTAYLVQVQAVAYWGQKRLKSSKSQLTFTTPSTAGSPGAASQGQVTAEVSNELPTSHSTPTLLRLEAASPHYHNNQLQVKVFWKKRLQETVKDSTLYLLRWYPDVCANNVTKTEKTATVQGTHFVITGLLFACKYRVAVMPMSGQGHGSEAVTSVTTPQCSAVKGRGVKSVSCAREERHPLARKAQQRPERLTAAFHTVNGSLQGIFSWQVSQAAPGQGSIAGFQFSWVQVSSSTSTTAVSDTLISQTQILAPDQYSLTVDHLQPESVYKVQVQALSAGGSGPSVVRTLHTPQLNGTLL